MLSGAVSGVLLLLGGMAYFIGHGRLPAAYHSHVRDNSPLLLNLHATHKTLIYDYDLFRSLLSRQRVSHSRVKRAS